MTDIDETVSAEDEQRGGGMSVLEFCAWAGIGRTKTYAEITAGRLHAKKCGRRTIIKFEDARRWLNQLPAKPLQT